MNKELFVLNESIKQCINERNLDRKNIILEKTIDFSLAIIQYCDQLEAKKKYVIARQLLRSATSVGANVHEAQNCESKADFIHKIKIAAKEAEETKYWLTLCEKSDSYPFDEKLKHTIQEINLIIYKILSTSIKSKKSTNNKRTAY